MVRLLPSVQTLWKANSRKLLDKSLLVKVMFCEEDCYVVRSFHVNIWLLPVLLAVLIVRSTFLDLFNKIHEKITRCSNFASLTFSRIVYRRLLVVL